MENKKTIKLLILSIACILTGMVGTLLYVKINEENNKQLKFIYETVELVQDEINIYDYLDIKNIEKEEITIKNNNKEIDEIFNLDDCFENCRIIAQYKNKTTEMIIKIKTAEKINKEKYWVHDASYPYIVSQETYLTYYKWPQNVKDIIAPYINIKTDDAQNSNLKIKELYDNAISVFNQGINDKLTYVDEFDYKHYINDNVLSIVIKYGIGATDVVNPSYYTFNISTKTGELVSYENNIELENKVKNAIDKYIRSKYNETEIVLTDMIQKSFNKYKESVQTNEIQYYLNSNNQLCIVVDIMHKGIGRGYSTIIITVI